MYVTDHLGIDYFCAQFSICLSICTETRLKNVHGISSSNLPFNFKSSGSIIYTGMFVLLRVGAGFDFPIL